MRNSYTEFRVKNQSQDLGVRDWTPNTKPASILSVTRGSRGDKEPKLSSTEAANCHFNPLITGILAHVVRPDENKEPHHM